MKQENVSHTVTAIAGIIAVTVLAVFDCLDHNIAVGFIGAACGIIPAGAMMNAWLQGLHLRNGDTQRIEREVARQIETTTKRT